MDNMNLPSPMILNKFYKDISNLMDCVIVNGKQRNAIQYEILNLMNKHFLFELPETNEE